MNHYLLDTHTVIWAVIDDTKLSKNVRQILQDRNNVLLVSAVSFWEIAIKYGKGKLDLENLDIYSIPDYCGILGIEQIPLMPDEAINYSRLSLSENHKDPFDRMLIYQCIKNGYILVSKDNKMNFYEKEGLNYIW